MPEWEEWFCLKDGAFCLSQELYMEDCPKITKSLPKHLPSLMKLKIERCGKLGGLLPMAPSISKLDLNQCDALRLEPLPCGLPQLQIYKLNIKDSILEQMEGHYTHLEKLVIWNCYGLRSFLEEEIEFFPDEHMLPSTPTGLDLYRPSSESYVFGLQGPSTPHLSSHIGYVGLSEAPIYASKDALQIVRCWKKLRKEGR
ncbi:hypothetical protein SCA6_005631 [Theobroma cacao]